ncbi:NAD-dependent epimerase/dehydratase family protein [Diaminobutyricimonas sp. TR449]|uniref:NAD-dependent epimerase/dehydratase family protein n=1 Tax=Diaminobutyricimonas sp. TR449 TaxID=2708076 RepID=UPI00141ECFEA|nr:NAD-dependent epimerase/dehydratase family protein [Diaminobutyricimonas sp. TR449]
MSESLVVGAGAIGSGVARELIARGDRVTVASRSATAVDGATAVALDASDAAAIAAAAAGHDTIFLTPNPTYHKWPELWPPLYRAAIEAASRSGARLIVMSNLYAYGEGASMPMTESSPLHATAPNGKARQQGWELVKAAHDRGEIRAVEVRASDYFGPGVGGTSQMGSMFFEPVVAGKTARVVGSATQPHTFSYLPDIVRTLVAAADSEHVGRVWHVPSPEPLTRLQLAEQVNALTGRQGKVRRYPAWEMTALGVFVPFLKAVNSVAYQFDKPFVMDSTETEQLLGLTSTPWDDALAATVDWYQSRVAHTAKAHH